MVWNAIRCFLLLILGGLSDKFWISNHGHGFSDLEIESSSITLMWVSVHSCVAPESSSWFIQSTAQYFGGPILYLIRLQFLHTQIFGWVICCSGGFPFSLGVGVLHGCCVGLLSYMPFMHEGILFVGSGE